MVKVAQLFESTQLYTLKGCFICRFYLKAVLGRKLGEDPGEVMTKLFQLTSRIMAFRPG